MTAPRGSMSDTESSSGGSDAEELARCREAALPAWGLERRPKGPEKQRAGRDCASSLAEGRRVFPAAGRMDGEETSGTPLSRESSRDWMWVECLLTRLPWASHGARHLSVTLRQPLPGFSRPPFLRPHPMFTPWGRRRAVSSTYSDLTPQCRGNKSKTHHRGASS